MSNVAKMLAVFTAEDRIIGCKHAFCKKITPLYNTREDLLSGDVLLYFIFSNHNCEMLIGVTDTGIVVN